MTASTGNVPGRIFMSYRREDTAFPAGWLYDRLVSHFGRGQVFKDIDSIELGDDFIEVITTAVGSCDVLLALIGDRWLTITGQDGRRRLDNPDDFVRLELEAALVRDVRVIPILVDVAQMPRADELPLSLAKLVRRQALELSPNRFDTDTRRLLRVLDRTVAEAQEQARHDAKEEAAARQRQVEQLQGQLRERAAVQDWQAVLAASGELAALDPAAADPDGLASAAGEQITRRQEAEQKARQEAEAQAQREAQEADRQRAEAQAQREAQEAERRKAQPKLELSTLAVDFGRIQVGSRPSPRPVKVRNVGGGNLNARIGSAPEWIQVQQIGDTFTLRPEPKKRRGDLAGDVRIDSDGGPATIRVTATIDSPSISPKLELSTLAVDFGRMRVGSKPSSHRVKVRNVGGGNLNARIASVPAWIKAQLTGGTLTLKAEPKAPGMLFGDVLIDSDAGPARIHVTATVDSPGASPTRAYYQGYKLATWWQRVGAHLIDLLALILGTAAGLGARLFGAVIVFLAIWFYNRCYLQGRTGQSWGKRAMRLKLVRMSHKEPIGSWKAAIRNLAHVLDILTLYLLPIWDARRQTLADKAMKTVVISLKLGMPGGRRRPTRQ
jgi:uncharacterized RDD family membrane protein YckC